MIDLIVPWWAHTDDEQRVRIRDFTENYWCDAGFAVIYGVDDSIPFNRSKARNNGVRQSTSKQICLLDADVLIDPRLVMEATGRLDESWFIPYTTYYNLTQACTESVLSGSRVGDVLEYDHRILSWAGCLVVDRDIYWSVGGSDERFVGWGWEDVALRLSLDNLYKRHLRCDGDIFHLWHPVTDSFGSENEKSNKALFDAEYAQRYGWVDERLTWF